MPVCRLPVSGAGCLCRLPKQFGPVSGYMFLRVNLNVHVFAGEVGNVFARRGGSFEVLKCKYEWLSKWVGNLGKCWLISADVDQCDCVRVCQRRWQF